MNYSSLMKGIPTAFNCRRGPLNSLLKISYIRDELLGWSEP